MTLKNLLIELGDEVQDPEEESFLLFSQTIPSQNLGFIDPKATSLEIEVAGRHLIIQQSPSLLSSNRDEGTTGAVVWKITPLFASWIASEDNILFRTTTIHSGSTVLELGCGISGVVGLALSPKIQTYLATDQEYLFKTLKLNIEENAVQPRPPITSRKRGGKHAAHGSTSSSSNNIKVVTLDWETSLISSIPILIGLGSPNSFEPTGLDVVLACDCIYNEALVNPFVQTCVDLCQLPKSKPSSDATLCIIAQQLRSHMVFEAWLLVFHGKFRVWRIPDRLLHKDLREGSGFVIHVGVLREIGTTE